MARFYGQIQGNRGEASRMGTAKSGFDAHIRGWNVGVRIECLASDDGVDGSQDVIKVYQTSGSNGGDPDVLLATLKENDILAARI